MQPPFILSKSKYLQRKIRRYDDPPDVAIPTWTLMREAILAGRTDGALEFLQDGQTGAKSIINGMIAAVVRILTYVADTFGEEQVEEYWSRRAESLVSDWLAQGYSVEEQVQIDAEEQRRLAGEFSVAEERDRYVLTCDPCGSGGQARRNNVGGVTKKAYPWSWGKSGVPYYCCHCCIVWEIVPTKIQGYPIRINLLGDRPEDPCVHLFYKKPELISEEYFSRIGEPKTIGRPSGAFPWKERGGKRRG